MMAVEGLGLVLGGAADVSVIPFDEVYARHADQVYRFCVSLLRNPSDAEDVAANAFLAAYAAYDRVAPPESELRPWLFRIARNAAVDQLRRRSRALRLVAALRHRAGGDDVETIAELHGDIADVVRALGTLSRRERELVGLRVAGELRYAEIGAVLGMSEQAAKTATRRALARLTARTGGRP